MPAKGLTKKRHFNPPLRKRFVTSCEGYDLYSVNAFAVRNIAQPDEEFTNFATKDDFPNLIPAGEIWVSDRNLEKEGVFFLANAIARLKERERGASDDRATDAGLAAERILREKHNGVKFRDGKPHRHVPDDLYAEHYLTLPDPEFPVEVWLIDGNLVRSYYKTDYTEGGHGYVYPWVPKRQIWVEKDMHRRELPYIVSHEYIELRLMRDEGLGYDRAHAICSRVEFKLRKGRGIAPLLLRGRERRLTKRDLPRLTDDAVLKHVVQEYVKS
jgi:hypothetical protein